MSRVTQDFLSSSSRLTCSCLNCTVPASSREIFRSVVISQSMRESSS